MVFLNLANVDKRKGEQDSAAAVVNRLRGPLMPADRCASFPVPAAGDFRHQQPLAASPSRCRTRAATRSNSCYNVTQNLVRDGNSRKDLSGLFSSFTANDPQFVVNIDRAKARSLQVPIQQITDTLQVYLGSAYVNDFDFNNRAYRVYVQADQGFRRQPRDIRQFYVRSDNNQMVPLDNVVQHHRVNVAAGDQPLQSVPLG